MTLLLDLPGNMFLVCSMLIFVLLLGTVIFFSIRKKKSKLKRNSFIVRRWYQQLPFPAFTMNKHFLNKITTALNIHQQETTPFEKLLQIFTSAENHILKQEL